MAALDGALALAQGDHVAVLVGQNLELDVARLLDKLFHIELAVAEGLGRLGLAPPGRGWQLLLVADDAHAASAAARCSLEDDGEADLPSPLQRVIGVGNNAIGAGKNGHAGFFALPAALSPFRP